jgi:hypothetical protein
MRILVVQDQLRVGGTEKQSLFLARNFQEAGHEVVLLTFRPRGHLATAANLAGLQVEVLQGFDSGISLWAPGLMRRIRQVDPDVILCMGRTANCYAGFYPAGFEKDSGGWDAAHRQDGLSPASLVDGHCPGGPR